MSRLDGDDFRAFAKTIGLNERQAAHALSRIADSMAANIDNVLADSPLAEEFAERFRCLVRSNLDKFPAWHSRNRS